MKTKLSLFLLSILSILAPIKPLLGIVITFTILDLFFGIWKSVKLGGWKVFRSFELTKTVSKTLLYIGAIVSVYFLEKYLLEDILGLFVSVHLVLTKAFTFFCTFIEIKSINESYEDVTGKNVLKSFKEFLTRTKNDLTEFKN
jgi:hypothetical protein